MIKFDFLKNATVLKRDNESTLYMDEKKRFFRILGSIEESEVIKESDKRILFRNQNGAVGIMSKEPIKETLIGDYVKIPLIHTAEQLDEAREAVVNGVCEQIRQIAQETPEIVFIEKEFQDMDKTYIKTVGLKLYIPVPKGVDE